MNKNEMEKYLEKQYPNESAILLIGSIFYILGISGFSKNHVIVDYRDLTFKLDKANKKDKIVFIHSHIDCSSKPSNIDIEIMELWDMEWWIYSIYGGKINDVWKSI